VINNLSLNPDGTISTLSGCNGSWLKATAGATTTVAMGFNNVLAGTGTAKTLAITNEYTVQHGVELLVASGGAVVPVAGFRFSFNQTYFSNVTHRGGFYYYARFGTATGNSTAGRILFHGFDPNLSFTAGQPSAFLNAFGLAYDSTDTTYQIICNGASGTATKVNTGIAIETVDRSEWYELIMFAKPNSTSVDVIFTKIGATPTIFKTTLNNATKLPAVNTLFSVKFFASNTTVGTPRGVAIGSAYFV
jgi:hypothetical protein